ncbi:MULTISPECIES: GAF domain-containing protein [Nocardia]|uniref:GAF domain-containing protein n=1 Tax=Nocardia TaxID=1817 RepID=UPI000FD8AD24|nr:MULTISPECIES: GAF domain-containing protein [Nocardia]MBF6188852.1 DUF5593 domain-containing protein [Nocardia farcinica]MBF6314025.1 DUF5593 domain-containing protein [Nocardia farcinica]MBF6410512.1 DUF5593 domain-containing protein [Nocardia farcinica]MBF6523075.1 DUF5593 domain-containing protein [Nocardia farcinica]UEX20806.1 DUF5593 domain-containing protein [Nocardia farcinica]
MAAVSRLGWAGDLVVSSRPAFLPSAHGGGPYQAGGHARENPWVLVQIERKPAQQWVVAEGGHPRRHTRLSRTRIAGSAAVGRQLPALVEIATAEAQPRARSVYLPSGTHIRLFAVPVTDSVGRVAAVQAWAGPRSRPIPARPAVGVISWPEPATGLAVTTPAAETLLDTGTTGGATRPLADLLGRLAVLEDRLGLLQLLDPAADRHRWSALAVSRGHASATGRSLFLAATRHADPPGVTAVVCDVSAAHPPAPTPVSELLVRAVPAPRRHGIAVVDLATGLVHDWIRPAPEPVHRWRRQHPIIHPHDQVRLAETRTRLIGGAPRAALRWRLRFEPADRWTCIHTRWTVLTRTPTPQAMLDIRLANPRIVDTGTAPDDHGEEPL